MADVGGPDPFGDAPPLRTQAGDPEDASFAAYEKVVPADEGQLRVFSIDVSTCAPFRWVDLPPLLAGRYGFAGEEIQQVDLE
jgi:hypothetical protein